MEIQIEHQLDLLKSIIYPTDASRRGIKRILMMSVFARAEMSANNKFLNSMFFGNKGKGRVLKFDRKFNPTKDKYNSTVQMKYAGDYNLWALLLDPMNGLKPKTEYAM